MALDYNKLMEELGNCLGLEGSATESYNKGPGKKAFEEYDEVEQELAASLGQPIPENVSDQDLVFEEGSEETNPDPEAGEGESVPEGEEEQPEEELFKESVKSYLTKLLEDKSPEEAKEFIGGLFGKALSEVCPDDEGETDGENPEEGSEGEVVPEEEGSSADDPGEGESGETDADEGCGDEDPEAAFESLQAKMLDRYKTLSRKKNKKNSATEGTGTKSKPILDETAIARTSAEFGYSGQNLRKMVAEAIEKGVI